MVPARQRNLIDTAARIHEVGSHSVRQLGRLPCSRGFGTFGCCSALLLAHPVYGN